jgi:succinate dehydrogenase / fumarate reductase, cytochrome b subunit
MEKRSIGTILLRWFDPRNRQIGTWAFILGRITAIGLVVYLTMHLFVLTGLAMGEQTYTVFLKAIKNPIVTTGEMLVVAGGIIHGLNGIRVWLNSFGIGVRYQKQMFVGLMVIALAGVAYFAFRMYA